MLWRRYAARVAATLATPIDRVLGMRWDEMLLWYVEAREIDRETWAYLRGRGE